MLITHGVGEGSGKTVCNSAQNIVIFLSGASIWCFTSLLSLILFQTLVVVYDIGSSGVAVLTHLLVLGWIDEGSKLQC